MTSTTVDTTRKISQRIADELGVRDSQVVAAVELLDGGATVPFVARYRKEVTGSLDDDTLSYDEAATSAERASRPAPSEAFFDRGPGYSELASGAAYAEVDLV